MAKSRIPEGITREHVGQALVDFRRGAAHEFGESTHYDLLHEGDRFPPKAIIGLAAQRATGRLLTPKDFSGGEGSKCFRVLRKLGFVVEPKPTPAWDLEPGDEMKRTELHARFGGRRQGGIAPSSTSPNVLIFTAPESGEQRGYFDGWQDDGSFHYTGEGQRGDMQMVQGNKAILEHRRDGRSIRLFEGARGVVTYRGELAVDEAQPFHRTDGPEKGSDLIREVIVFHLVPVDRPVQPVRVRASPPALVVDHIAPEAAATDTFGVRSSGQPREAERRESKLVADYRAFCGSQGRRLVRQKICPPGEQPLYTDLFDETKNLLIEAKGSVTRESIRMAIGQLLDYQRFIEPKPGLAVLLPTKPRNDLLELLRALRIILIYRDGGEIKLIDHSDVDRYRQSLLSTLANITGFIRELEVLRDIYDDHWRIEIAAEIQDADLSGGSFGSQRCPLFFLFKDDPSPLRDLDKRLLALRLLDPNALEAKIREIRACRLDMKQLEHLFELGVLGVFAQQACLEEVEVPVGPGTVDGRLRLQERSILIEVTLTTQQLLATGPGVFSIAIETLTKQIELKVRKKVADSRQLALADSTPAILVIGLHPFAADQHAARWGIEECFARAEYASASAVVVSDSWKFSETRLHVNPNAKNPLNDAELQRLRECLVAAAASSATHGAQ